MTDKAFNLKLIAGGDEPACVEVSTETGAIWARVYAPTEAEAIYRAQMLLAGYNDVQEISQYLKRGETALQCVERNRKDALLALDFYATEMNRSQQLAKAFMEAMGRLEDMMKGDDGQAWSETERVMPRLRDVLERHPTIIQLRVHSGVI